MTRIYEVIKLEPKPVNVILGSIYDSSHHTLSVKCSFFYDKYKKLIICFGVFLIVLIIAFVSILVSNNDVNKDNKCIIYSDQDYASSVSMDCFKYIWSRTCNSNVPENFDGGWWLRSPDGGKTVPCYPSNKGKCGAGSYGTIRTNIFKCNLYYEGL